MKIRNTALIAAIALTTGTVASAGSHSLFVDSTTGITDFSGMDFGLTVSEANGQFVFDVSNNSTDGSVITGVYFEMDEVNGRDYDMRQYVIDGTQSADMGVASSLDLGEFQSVWGWAGADLSGLQMIGDKTHSSKLVQYIDTVLNWQDYRVGYTIENANGSAFVVTGRTENLFIAPPVEEIVLINETVLNEEPVDTNAVSMPSPTAAGAGLALLGLLGARRRRQA